MTMFYPTMSYFERIVYLQRDIHLTLPSNQSSTLHRMNEGMAVS